MDGIKMEVEMQVIDPARWVDVECLSCHKKFQALPEVAYCSDKCVQEGIKNKRKEGTLKERIW